MFDLSFPARLGVLVAVLATVAAVDWLRKRDQAAKWCEYLFLLGVGVVGGCFGMGVDQISGRISPEYFLFGKEIALDDRYWANVMVLGFQAGFVGGALVAVAAMMANNARADVPQLGYRTLMRPLWIPVMAAAIGALIGGWLGAMDLFSLADGLEASRIEGVGRLLTVQGAHFGLYLGAVLGAVILVVWIRRRRFA